MKHKWISRALRRVVCASLILCMACSFLGGLTFGVWRNPEPDGKTLFGASYCAGIEADRPYKDYVNPAYETKIALGGDERIIDYAKSLGTDIPVIIFNSNSGKTSVVWNNGHPDADPVGTKYYYAYPDLALTPVVNGTVEVSEYTGTVSFTDVKEKDYFYDAVRWGVSDGVVYGLSKTTFAPENTCVHAQILALIYRAAGSPTPGITTSPYSNVKSSDYFYNAVLWAYEKGVLTSQTFNPDAPCTRADTVLYLWRADGCKRGNQGTAFTDVDANAEYAEAVAWASSNQVVYGTSKTTFAPKNTCTRGQIITILHRYLGYPAPSDAKKTTQTYKYAKDVTNDNPYATAINYCIENRLFKLGSDGMFHPERGVSYVELSEIMQRVHGWAFADDDHDWDGSRHAKRSETDDWRVDARLWWGDWSDSQFQYYALSTISYRDFGYKDGSPEPDWFKTVNNYAQQVWLPTVGSFSFSLTKVDFTADMTIKDFVKSMYRFQECISYDENRINQSTYDKRVSLAGQTSRYAEKITLAEVCQTLYELGMKYNGGDKEPILLTNYSKNGPSYGGGINN